MRNKKAYLLGLLIALSFLMIGWKLGRSSAFKEIHSAEGSGPADTASKTPRKRPVDEMAEGRRRAWESIHQQRLQEEADGTNRPPFYTLFSPSGQLTTGAAEAAKLTPEERTKVDDALRDAWKEAAISFGERAVLDEHQSSSKEGNYSYRVAAAPDRGAAKMTELQNTLSNLIGEDRQKILLRGLGDYDCFANFGKRDIVIEVSTKENTYRYEYLNPESGRASRTGSAVLENFRQQFGDAVGRGVF